MTATKPQQENNIGQGLAAALVEMGVTGVTSGRQGLQFAWQRAWRDWPEARRFPQVRADLDRSSIERIMAKSANRRGPLIAAWESVGGWWEPYLVDGADLDDAIDLLPKFSEVPWPAWQQLARLFVDAFFQPDQVRRADGATADV